MHKINEHHFKDQGPKEINLREYFTLIKKRFWIILLVTLIAGAGGYIYSNMNSTPLYETSTRVIIGTGEEEMDMNTLMVMITDPMIMETVANELQLARSPGQIAGQIEVTQIEESQVVSIKATDSDPETAMNIANSTAAMFKQEIKQILDFKGVQLLSEAELNTAPINTDQNRTLIMAIVFGLMTGIGLVFILDAMDGAIRKEDEAEDILGVPVLGTISNMTKRKFVNKKKKTKEMAVRGETVDIK
ncbi:Capsular polysaccharide biosynthesis protein [Lentibacillus persicus]|uniref:Capsular polysaccharide biosynthesis protein n=1 Tax=Lentibacillus persicus TaxID=640948 RepID=A0A1I1U9B4_9BACI|nr:Wzz/FepE/Etk N-terminal domain-containing protein [Lentibacillus persicus]SFD67432.1 Capsular polysaccharide biosynthesis protein [Lentibacillus persicus]